MEKLSNPQKTIEIIKKYGFTFSKRYGQNFLIDGRVLDKIVAGADITKADAVLEIGPGIGTMTQYLAEAAGSVTAVEVDKKLLPILDETLAEYDNVNVINEDIMKVDLPVLLGKILRGAEIGLAGKNPDEMQQIAGNVKPEEGLQNAGENSGEGQQAAEEDSFEGRQQSDGGENLQRNSKGVKVLGNLPYYITTPIIMMLLEQELPIKSITVMVQKEVAKRMMAAPGDKDCGAISLAVQYYAEPYIVANVPRNCFMPRPNVDSAVIRLTRLEAPRVSTENPQLMFKLIRAAFGQRRKTLVNGIANSQELNFTKDQAAAAIIKAGLQESVRGEKLGLAEFAALSDVLEDKNGKPGKNHTA